MRARDIIVDLPPAPGDPRQNLLYARLLLLYLADHVSELRDATDFRQWLLDLAKEAREIGKEKAA
jgi:hypothetical protein